MATSTTISGLTALGAAPATNDLLVLVDVSDTTQAATGTTKRMTVANLFTSPALTGTTTMAAVNISGDVAVNTNKFTVAASSGNTLIAGTLTLTGNFLPASDLILLNTKYLEGTRADSSVHKLIGFDGTSLLQVGADGDTVHIGVGGLAVTAGGAAITGNSTITGTLTGLTGLTVASGGATITAGGLTVTAGGITINGGKLSTVASSTAAASLLLPSGTAPTAPADGDMWYDGINVHFRVGLTTKTFTLT